MFGNKKIISIALSSALTATASLGASAVVLDSNNSLNDSFEETTGVISSMSPIGEIINGVTITEVIDLEHREREDGLIDLVDPTSGNVWFILEVHE